MITIALALLLAVQAPEDLLPNSRFVTSTKGWTESQYTVGTYQWVTPTTLYYLKYPGQGEMQIWRLDVGFPNNPKLLDSFSRMMQDHGGGLGAFDESSNDKHLLWRGGGRKSPTWFVSDLEGSIIGQFPDKKVGTFPSSWMNPELWSIARWSSDGSEIFESQIDRKSGNIIVSRRPLADLSKESYFPKLKTDIDDHPWYLVGHGAFMSNGDQSLSRFVFWNLDRPNTTLRKVNIKIPQGWKISAQELSPDFKQMLWELEKPDYSAWSLWVGPSDMSSMHEVATLKYGHDANTDRQHFGGLLWCRDSRRISFICNYKLYLFDLPI